MSGYVLRVSSYSTTHLLHDYYTGAEAHGGRAWSPDPREAWQFPSREAAEAEARTLARWHDNKWSEIIWVES